MVPVLARAGVAVGVAGLFMETHPKPAEGLVRRLQRSCRSSTHEGAAGDLVALDDVTKKNGFLENNFGA